MKFFKIILFINILILAIACNKDLCEDVNCSNGGICNTETGNCDCIDGYTGAFCDTAPDLCEDVNCLNGGTCNTGNCDCIDGFTGENCEIEPVIDLCENVDCQNGGTCDEVTGECICIDGYTGDSCETPPTAPTSSFELGSQNVYTVSFTNTSTEATDYAWNFGDGNTSTDENPTHPYATFGNYTVTLTASNAFLSDDTSMVVAIQDTTPVVLPVISEAGFEDDSNISGCVDGLISGNTPPDGDGRDCWRNDAGGVIQITADPVFDGNQAAKLPNDATRVGMQQVNVEPYTDYNLSFWYTMKVDPGVLTVAILNEFVVDTASVASATIESLALTDNSDPDTYVNEILSFNSGNNSAVTIYFGNVGSECRLDNFEFIE